MLFSRPSSFSVARGDRATVKFETCNMDISYRAVIRCLDIKGLTPKEIREKVAKPRQNDPLYSMVKKWAAEFKRGRESLEDDPPSETAINRHHTGNHWKDSWHHHGRQTSNGVLHCHCHLRGPHPCCHPQRTSYVQCVSTFCPKVRWTCFETNSAQYVKGKYCHFVG